MRHLLLLLSLSLRIFCALLLVLFSFSSFLLLFLIYHFLFSFSTTIIVFHKLFASINATTVYVLFSLNLNHPFVSIFLFSSHKCSHTNFHTVNLRIIENHMKFPFHLLYRFIKSFLLSFKLNDFLC